MTIKIQARRIDVLMTGPDHDEPDADAVMLAAADCHTHNLAAHEPALEGMLF